MGHFSEAEVETYEDQGAGLQQDTDGVQSLDICEVDKAEGPGDGGSSLDAEAKAAAEDEERRAHEEKEAKRKAEWEAKQAKKKESERQALAEVQAMDDGEVEVAAAKRLGKQAERVTRRNMKECITEHIQENCFENPQFARLTMHPKKSMVNCFLYVQHKAREYALEEMKDKGLAPEDVQVYDCDVPDDLVLCWAEEYFYDENAAEDGEEEKFEPEPYRPKYTPTPRKKAAAKKTEKPAKPPKPTKAEQKQKEKSMSGQVTLGDFGTLDKAG